MNLVCYLYYSSAIKDVYSLVSVLNRLIKLDNVCIVVNKNIDFELVERTFSAALFQKVNIVSYNPDNWEFCAYDLGIDSVCPSLNNGVIIFNDTAGRNYPLFNSDLRRFVELVKIHSGDKFPVYIGKVESAGRQFFLDGMAFNSWIRSNIFYMNKSAIESVGHVFDESLFKCPYVDRGRFVFGERVSSTLADYINNWLSPSGEKNGWLAHVGKKDVSSDVLLKKAGSILLEKRLSAIVSNGGGALVTYEPLIVSFLYKLRIRLFFKVKNIKSLIANYF